MSRHRRAASAPFSRKRRSRRYLQPSTVSVRARPRRPPPSTTSFTSSASVHFHTGDVTPKRLRFRRNTRRSFSFFLFSPFLSKHHTAGSHFSLQTFADSIRFDNGNVRLQRIGKRLRTVASAGIVRGAIRKGALERWGRRGGVGPRRYGRRKKRKNK